MKGKQSFLLIFGILLLSNKSLTWDDDILEPQFNDAYEEIMRNQELMNENSPEDEKPINDPFENQFGFLEENNILLLKNSDINSAISKFDNLLLIIYAPWSNHSKLMLSRLEFVAKGLNSINLNLELAFGKIDATKNEEVLSRFDVKGYPTLKFFKKGKPVEYTGSYTNTSEMKAWLINQLGPASIEIINAVFFEELKNDNEVLVTFFGNSEEDLKIFEKVSQKFESIIFAHTHYYPLLEEKSKIEIYKNFNREMVKYKSSFTESSLIKFIEENRYQNLVSFEHDSTIERIWKFSQPAIILYYKEKNSQAYKEFAAAARQHKNRIIFGTTMEQGGPGRRVKDFIGGELIDGLGVYILDPRSKKYEIYKLDGKIDQKLIKKFIDDFESKKLSKLLKKKSAFYIENGTLNELDKKMFEEIVLESQIDVPNSQKNILVMFYSPGFEICEIIDKKLEEMASLVGKEVNLAFAKINVDKYKIKNLNMVNNPSIKLYKKDQKKNPLNFDFGSSWDNDNFIKFLAEELGDDFKLNFDIDI